MAICYIAYKDVDMEDGVSLWRTYLAVDDPSTLPNYTEPVIVNKLV